MEIISVSYETLKKISNTTDNYFIVDQDREVLDVEVRTYSVSVALSEFPHGGLPTQLPTGYKYKLG